MTNNRRSKILDRTGGICMEGTVVRINKATSKIFTILGDDGVEYFGHLHNLANKKEFKHFFYKGSRCSFDIIDEGKAHLKAINIVSDGVYDPLAEERKLRAQESKARHEEKEKIKAARKAVESGSKNLSELKETDPGYVRHVKQLERHKRNQAWDNYLKEKTHYAVQIRRNEKWVFLNPLVYSKDIQETKYIIARLKTESPMERYRVKKCTIHTIGGKEIAKDLEK